MSDDSDDLRLLVEMAVAGELSASEVADVEALLADKPALRAEYERLRRPAPAPSTGDRQRGGAQSSGCLLAIISAVAAGSLVIAGAIVVRSGDADSPPTNPVDAILSDADIQNVPLDGPAELTDLNRLALVYSPADGDAVLIGDGIVSGGELVEDTGGQQTVLAVFEPGEVSVLLLDIDPDARYEVRRTP